MNRHGGKMSNDGVFHGARLLAVMAVLWLGVAAGRAADAAAGEPGREKRAAEIKSLRWGMFVCWSFSTFSGREWSPGIRDVAFFRATSVDTDQWARTAKEAGMGYILFLTKHHDGFCLWDTRTTDRKVTKAPLGRDVLAELRKSCDKYGIKLALYFSEGDWSWPGAADGKNGGSGKDPEREKAQLRELCTQYGPIEFFWMDHAAGSAGLSHRELAAWVKQFQPGCFVGCNYGGPGDGTEMRAGENGRPGATRGFLVSEFTYPILPAHSGGAMWFYSLPEHDHLCREAADLYQEYAKAVKTGSIFSLDVGPDYQGRLREIDVTTLRQVGEWIRQPAHAPQPLPPALSTGKPARASSVWDPSWAAAANAFDEDNYSRWTAKPGATSGWLEVDLGRPEQVGRVEILERSYPRTREFRLECQENGQWRELARGTTIGGRQTLEFPAVTAQVFRLNILKAVGAPSIEDLRLLPPLAAGKGGQ